MNAIFWEISKRNIRVHFLRSVLAMLGIVIGVVAIVSMGILGNGMVMLVSDSLSSVGDTVIVYPYFGGGMGMGGGSLASLSLTEQNFQQIKRAVAPNAAIPVHSSSERMKVGVTGDNIVATIYGLPAGDVPALLDLAEGDYNNQDSGCLVGSLFAEDHSIRIGSRISIGSEGQHGTLRVTGIIEERGMSFDISTDNAVVVTDRWFESAFDTGGNYDQVIVKVTQGETASAKAAIEKQLNRNIKDKAVFVMDSKETLESIYAAFGSITLFVTAIGGISMIVAGVSIFNIMMMSVNERIKEIGIMRSIGTRRRGVMTMFIYEAAIIGVTGSLIGGIISIIAGYGISALILETTDYLVSLSNVITVVQGIGFGILVCLVCGLYPAWQAANLNPIDALRHE